jgi:hypothetical protein
LTRFPPSSNSKESNLKGKGLWDPVQSVAESGEPINAPVGCCGSGGDANASMRAKLTQAAGCITALFLESGALKPPAERQEE